MISEPFVCSKPRILEPSIIQIFVDYDINFVIIKNGKSGIFFAWV